MADETTAATDTSQATAPGEEAATAAADPKVAASSPAPEAPAEGESSPSTDDKADDKPADEPVDYGKALAEGLPEGQEADTALIEAVLPILAEHKIPVAAAVALRDAYAARIAETSAATVSQWTDTVKGWETAIRDDKEFGGQKLDETKANAAYVLDKFGTPDLRKDLDTFGFGNHPGLVKALATAGAALKSAGIDPGAEPVAASNPLKALYPNSPELFKDRN